MKGFVESLQDGFSHVVEITDPEFLSQLRSEGIRIDDEGYYVYSFGDRKEYELRVEPVGEDGQYFVALYKNRVLLTHKLPIWMKKEQ